MRPWSALVSAIVLALAASAEAAPRKAQPAAPHGRARTPARAAAPSPSSAPSAASPDESTPSQSPSPSDSVSAAGSAAEPEPAPSSGDAKLDEPPPPQTKTAEGPKASPLTPEKNELPNGVPPLAPVDLDKVMADIATLRARVAALATSLFSSKLRVYVRTEGDDARIETFVVTLDDGVVFRSDPGFLAEDEKVLYDHALAPGSHVIGLEIERKDIRGAAFRTWQTSRFAIQVPERKTLEAIVVVEDDSNMAKNFPGDQDGKYDLRVKFRAKVAE